MFLPSSWIKSGRCAPRRLVPGASSCFPMFLVFSQGCGTCYGLCRVTICTLTDLGNKKHFSLSHGCTWHAMPPPQPCALLLVYSALSTQLLLLSLPLSSHSDMSSVCAERTAYDPRPTYICPPNQCKKSGIRTKTIPRWLTLSMLPAWHSLP